MSEHRLVHGFVVLIFLGGAVCGNCWGSIARAGTAEVPAELALARLCVNESGLRAYRLDDCAAIHAVVTFRAEHIYRSSYVEALHRYSQGVTIEPSLRRPWITDLWPDGRDPAGWPAHLPWTGRNARRWARTYQHAIDVFRGDIVAECRAGLDPVTPHTWAADTVRPADLAAHVVDCGATVNTFWAVPRYTERWGPS